MEEAESVLPPPVVREGDVEGPLEKRARIRAKVIKEIMDTEQTYQRHLELVIQYFEGPLHDLDLVPDHVIVTIFSNVRQIVSINQELMEHLGQAGVGQSFLRIGPFLKLYSTYANNHERALGAMIEWEQKRPEFGAWRRQQEELPEMMGLKLNSLLITPVQRVPRYKLLLEDLLSNTESSHEDYSAIEEAVKQISAVASHINEHIRQHDNFNKMLAIQKSLAGTGAPRILAPGRIFIKDGPLKKVSKKGGRSRERMFFLFSDILLYAKPKLVDQVLSGSYVCCCVFPLHHCRVDTVFGHSRSSGSLFTVTCKNESLLLYSDQKTVHAWITVLRNTIESLIECRQTLRKPSSALEPLRRPGLVQLRKRQKENDPLKNAKRTPERISHSPRSLKRALAEANINCLTPHKQMKPAGSPVLSISKVLSPLFSDSDSDDSRTPSKRCTQSEKKRRPTQSLTSPEAVTQSVGKSRHKRMTKQFMTRIRDIGNGWRRDKAVISDRTATPQHGSTRRNLISPEPKRQGPDCDIDEILDPHQPKWDIFDTALPDTSSVWRARLDSDPPNLQRPTVPARRKCILSDTDVYLQRPRSEISTNTSQIWKDRPDSEMSDELGVSSLNPDDSRPTIDSDDDADQQSVFRNGASPELSRTSRWEQRTESDSESDSTPYSHCSRDFLTRYTFNEDGSPKPMIYHKQSESMLLPWETQWTTPSPSSSGSSGMDPAQYRSPLVETAMTKVARCSPQPDVVPDRWQSLMAYDPAYPPPDFTTPPRMHPIEEDSITSEGSPPHTYTYFHSTPSPSGHRQPDVFTTPQKQTSCATAKSPWWLLESAMDTAGGAAQAVIHSPGLVPGGQCCIQ